MAEGMKQCCACRHKETERTDELQRDLTKRLNRAIGQLNGVKDMIADNRYCGDVLVQLAAAESAVHRIAEIVLQDHMETCVVEQVPATSRWSMRPCGSSKNSCSRKEPTDEKLSAASWRKLP